MSSIGLPNSPRITLLTGLLLPLSFAPLPFGFLAHFCLLPLFIGLYQKKPGTAFRWGFATGFLFYLGLLYWINFLKVEGITIFLLPLGVLFLIFYLSLYIGVFSFFLSHLQMRFGDRGYLFAPFLWTSLEFLRSLTTYGFPWGSLAYTQTSYIPFIQFADMTGIPGVTFWIVSINTALFYLIRNYALRIADGAIYDTPKSALSTRFVLLPAFCLLLLFVLPLIYGTRVLKESPNSPEIMVAIAQAEVPSSIRKDPFQSMEERFDILKKVSRGVTKEGVDLLIWPETATPGFPRNDQKVREEMEELTRELRIPILMGATDYLQGDLFNSAMLVDPETGLCQSYNKILLVPFGERLPFDDIFPPIRKLEMGQGHYSPGKERTLFYLKSPLPPLVKGEKSPLPPLVKGEKSPLPPLVKGEKGGFSFSTLICFESIFPWFVRSFVKKGAEFLVNITDDSWYGKSSGPFQHAQMAVFRSIENRRSLARCANTGVSMVVDPYGRVKRKTGIFTRVLLLERLPLRHDLTFYARFGDIFAWISVGLSLLAIGRLKLKSFKI